MPLKRRRVNPYDLAAYRRELLRIGGANLVAYWPLDDASGVTARDLGPNNEPLTITGCTLGQAGPPQLGRSHYFDGINDVDSQYVYDDQTGATWGPTVHGLCLANGVAFMRVQGVDLSTFKGVEGSSTPYMVTLTDSASKVAWGYLGNQEAAQSLGADLFDAGAGTFDSGTYSWAAYGANTIANDANTLKITYVDGSNGASLFLRDAADLSANLVTGKIYKLTFDAKVNTGSVTVCIWPSGGSVIDAVTVTETSMTSKTFYFTAVTTTFDQILMRYMSAGEIIWFDNIVLQEVTHVGTDAVHIVSTRNGSTRNWAGIEAGFNYNSASYTFSVLKSLFQQTSVVTCMAWVKLSVAANQVILSKIHTTNFTGYELRTDASGMAQFRVGDGADIQAATDTVALSTGRWYFVVGTYDGTNINVYVDGVLKASQAQSVPAQSLRMVRMGYDLTTYATGNMAHGAVVAAALTSAQVRRLYEIGRRAHTG